MPPTENVKNASGWSSLAQANSPGTVCSGDRSNSGSGPGVVGGAATTGTTPLAAALAAQAANTGSGLTGGQTTATPKSVKDSFLVSTVFAEKYVVFF